MWIGGGLWWMFWLVNSGRFLYLSGLFVNCSGFNWFLKDFNDYSFFGVSWSKCVSIFDTCWVNVGARVPVEVPLDSFWDPKQNNKKL